MAGLSRRPPSIFRKPSCPPLICPSILPTVTPHLLLSPLLTYKTYKSAYNPRPLLLAPPGAVSPILKHNTRRRCWICYSIRHPCLGIHSSAAARETSWQPGSSACQDLVNLCLSHLLSQFDVRPSLWLGLSPPQPSCTGMVQRPLSISPDSRTFSPHSLVRINIHRPRVVGRSSLLSAPHYHMCEC